MPRPGGNTFVTSHQKGGLTPSLIQKEFESLQNYPNRLDGTPTPIPSWLLDEMAHSQASYPHEWIQFGGRNTDIQFKTMTGKDINDPNTYEPGYSATLYNAVRPQGGTPDTGYENFTPSFSERNFTLKVTNQFVQNMGNIGWTFTPASTTQTSGFEFFPSAYAESESGLDSHSIGQLVTSTSTSAQGGLTWYYVKKPSGVCERLNVSQNFVNKMTSQGWIFSLTDICATEPEPEVTTVEVEPPGVAETSCYMVHGQQVELTEQAVDYYINAGVTVTPCEAIEPTPTPTPTPTTTPTGLANFGIAGVLFAGVLAVPILAGLGKWK